MHEESSLRNRVCGGRTLAAWVVVSLLATAACGGETSENRDGPGTGGTSGGAGYGGAGASSGGNVASGGNAPSGGSAGSGGDGWLPPPACELPFDPGPCAAAIPVYASVGGTCVPEVYGGCEGNENRFWLLEECMAACEGRPDPRGCPDGRAAQEICIGCGSIGGCGETALVCALQCESFEDCADLGTMYGCRSGICEITGCI